MATLHEYPVTVHWNGGRDGNGDVSMAHSGASFKIAVPPEFQGEGGGTNPEELLTSAIAACYSLTFGIIAANRKLPVKRLTAHATGVVGPGAYLSAQSGDGHESGGGVAESGRGPGEV